MSPHQSRLWNLQQAHGIEPFISSTEFTVRGELDRDVLVEALQHVVDRHEILRTVVTQPPGGLMPVQAILPRGHFRLSTGDGLSGQGAEHAFDLEHGPALHAALVSGSGGCSRLVLRAPSMCADGAGILAVAADFACCYLSRLSGAGVPAPAAQYTEFTEWLRESLELPEAAAMPGWWQARMQARAGRAAALFESDLPTASRFGPEFLGDAAVIDKTAIENAARGLNVSIPSWLMACWHAVLWRIGALAQSDIAAGLDLRAISPELTGLPGNFTVYGPIRVKTSGDQSFSELAGNMQGECLEAGLRRACCVWPKDLFPTFSFDYHELPVNYNEHPVDYNGVRGDGAPSFEISGMISRSDRFLIRLACIADGSALRVTLDYDRARFPRSAMHRLQGQFRAMLECALQEPSTPVGALRLLDAEQRRRILIDFNPKLVSYDRVLVHELIENRAVKEPDRPAVACGGKRLTYKELNVRASRLAGYLRAFGVRPGAIAAILLERSLDLPVWILAVLKAGGAWMPLDTSSPAQRIGEMLDEVVPAVIITQRSLFDLVRSSPAHTILVDQLSAPDRSAPDRSAADRSAADRSTIETRAGVSSVSTDPAYVIYTSGTMGGRKAVVVTHESLAHYVQALRDVLGTSAGDVWLHTAAFSFSSSVRQLMVPLAAGASVVLANRDELRSPTALFEMVKLNGVTVMDLVPSHWRTCLRIFERQDPERRRQLLSNQVRLMLSASEPLPDSTPRAWRDLLGCPVRWINMYGLTETTGIVAAYPVSVQDKASSVQDKASAVQGNASAVQDKASAVPIGKPFSNNRIYILDQRLKPAPIGVSGEICVSGPALAKGYAGAAGRRTGFVPNPFEPDTESRLYKTGDLGRYLPDGDIEYLGRMDSQVKIRGFRVSLAEIERAVESYPAVSRAAACALEAPNGEVSLVAYYVNDEARADSAEDLRRYLAGLLPDYMVPSLFMRVDFLPTTTSGKLDRSALPDPRASSQAALFRPPSTPGECALSEIWSDLFQDKHIGTRDNFFQIGGHSLMAAQLLSRIRDRFGIELSWQSVFDHPTIETMALLIGPRLAQPGAAGSSWEEGEL